MKATKAKAFMAAALMLGGIVLPASAEISQLTALPHVPENKEPIITAPTAQQAEPAAKWCMPRISRNFRPTCRPKTRIS